jgi:hypothetical protein
MGPYKVEVEFCYLHYCSSICAWDKKCHFTEAAYHYPDCIMFLLGCWNSTKEFR